MSAANKERLWASLALGLAVFSEIIVEGAARLLGI